MRPYYEQDGITIYHGDCRDFDLEADVLLCDPPYGIDYQSTWPLSHQRKSKVVGDSGLKSYEIVPKFWGKWCSLVFLRWDRIGHVEIATQRAANSMIIWDKVIHGMADLATCFSPKYEMVAFYREAGFKFPGARPSDIASVCRVHADKLLHPNEKPVELLKFLLGAVGGGLVLDPFSGAGSTLLAAKQLGRSAIGIEIEEKYCEIAAKRLSQRVMDF